MKKILMIAALCVGLASCGGGNAKQAVDTTRENGVDVLYFHGKQRCATCMAIERETKDVVDVQFADAVADGALEMRIIDITKPENEALADKYEITWSSLVVVKYEDGKEQAENLTKFAFANARNNPAKFKEELAAKINQMLK